MDIQKEREVFEVFFYENCLVQWEKDISETLFQKFESGDYEYVRLQSSWLSWQAAKAQAVPEGFVLIKASDRDQEVLELIDQRDYMESQAEELKDKLQALYGVDFGEQSSCNFPFQNAIDYNDSDLVLVEKSKIRTWYQDDDEPENFCNSESDLNCLGDCLDDDDIIAVNIHESAHISTRKVFGVWKSNSPTDIQSKFVLVDSHQEAEEIVASNKAMIESQEPPQP